MTGSVLKETNNLTNFLDSSKKNQKFDELNLSKMKFVDAKTAKQSVSEESLKFYKLFLTELRHQDPYKPVETHNMMEQTLNIHLAEQAIASNIYLEKLVELMQNQASYVGKNIRVLKMNTEIMGKLENGQLNQQFRLPEESKNVHIVIKTVEGNRIVKTATIEGKEGMNNYIWDGCDDSGNKLMDGEYIIDISAVDKYRKPLDTELVLTGKVESSFREGDAVKLVLENGEIVNLEDIRGVYDNIEAKETQNVKLNQNLEKLNAYLKNISSN